MEYLKNVFGDKALNFEEFKKAVQEDKNLKLANLSDGGYVDKQKFNNKVAELKTANETIASLEDTVSKFDDADIEDLRNQITALQQKYDADTKRIKRDSAINLALAQSGVRSIKAARAELNDELIKLDGVKIIGLDEQLNNLKKEKEWLFDEVGTIPEGTGHKSRNNCYICSCYFDIG